MRWQIPLVWLISSVATGTIAVLLTTGNDLLPVKPLFLLSAGEMVAVVLLVSGLVLGLFVVGWRTVEGTWLRWSDPRSVILWTILVAGGGFAGWGFAAVVTFESGFSLAAQLILAYTCGGLPFALVAGMLARPWQLNAAALMVTVIAVLVGLTLIPQPLQTLVEYLRYMVGWAVRQY
jgi:hypothetical protein